MMKGGLAGLMKQAQQMQENMRRAQAELAQREVEGQAGSGMVKIRATCDHEVKRVSIDASLMDDKDMLEDLLVVAFKDLHQQIEAATQERMAGFTSGMGLPPGMKLPF
ncbi:MAG: YbaB/EbfC family nucleoid-associated protein [Betaproteobacteria bacterium]|nr:YbaB/EbfC family nucleoid-associated protein [Betaproteobacteria bacterium]